jgi:hypothetical protein
MNAVHFSSKSDQWATPNWFYELIKNECDPTLDVCAEADKREVLGVFFTGGRWSQAGVAGSVLDESTLREGYSQVG